VRSVSEEVAGERLDRAVARLFEWSRGRARRVIEIGGAYVQGRRTRSQSRPVVAGEEIRVLWADPPDPEPEPLPESAVLLSERGLVAIDKPAGVDAQAARHRVAGTLPDLVARLLDLRRPPEPLHRLDRDTSGVMLMALDRAARSRFGTMLLEGKVRKEYLALVRGSPEGEGVIDAPLAPDPRRPGRWRIVEGGEGRSAKTRFHVLGASGGVSLVVLEPLTGRTHQLRVHCASRGWPVLGDRLYSPLDVAAMAPRLCLHARRLALPAGALGRPIVIEAPIPPALADILRSLALPCEPDRDRS